MKIKWGRRSMLPNLGYLDICLGYVSQEVLHFFSFHSSGRRAMQFKGNIWENTIGISTKNVKAGWAGRFWPEKQVEGKASLYCNLPTHKAHLALERKEERNMDYPIILARSRTCRPMLFLNNSHASVVRQYNRRKLPFLALVCTL